MKKQITKFVILMFILLAVPSNIIHAQNLSDRLSGKILLQVEDVGQAWYIDPETKERAFLGRPADAFRIMRELGLGISEKDYNSFNGYAPSRLSGKILLRVEANGEAYYVFPDDLKMHYLGRPADAFNVMREKGLGITDEDLNKVPVFQKYKEKIETLERKVEELAEKIEKLEGEAGSGESNDTATPTPPTTPVPPVSPPTSTSDTYFFEDFESGVQNWNFYPESAFSTIVEDGNTVLKAMGGISRAAIKTNGWDNYSLKVRFKRIVGSLYVNFRHNCYEHGCLRYSIGISEKVNNLHKELIGGGGGTLEDISFGISEGWHTFEIKGYDNILNIYIDDNLLVKYHDTENPVLSGGVAFETSDEESEFLIDDVEIKVITEEDIIYPVTPTTPTSTSDTSFFYNFDQGDSWTLNPESYDSRWAVVFPEDETNGMLTKVDDADYAYTSLGNPAWTDYKLRLRAKLEQGFIEINTRMSGEEGNYAVSIFDSQLTLDKDIKPRVKFETKDYSFNPDQFYDIRVELKGDNIKVYVDDELQIDYTDTGTPVLAGHLGLYISDKAYIDYVIVDAL